jgi:hypothetical protein
LRAGQCPSWPGADVELELVGHPGQWQGLGADGHGRLVELNALLLAADRADDHRRITNRVRTVGQDFALEAPLLRPLPGERFETWRVPDFIDTDLGCQLERLRKENAVLRMERDFAKKVATWFSTR